MDMDMNVDWYMYIGWHMDVYEDVDVDLDSSWVWIYINKYMDRGWYIDMIQIEVGICICICICM